MSRSVHFAGQPVFAQLLRMLDRGEVMRISKSLGGERYVKSFDAWSHLTTMLFATINCCDSLREISALMLAWGDKLEHLGMAAPPRRSTLAEANKRRPSEVFEQIYMGLYNKYKSLLSADSRTRNEPRWMRNLRIIDSTTISLFSSIVYKGAGRNPKRGRKKGGLKMHTIIAAQEGVPQDVRFTSAAKHDSLMLVPGNFESGEIVAMDRAYVDYAKMQQLTEQGVTYVTKMKSNLRYEVVSDVYPMRTDGVAVRREQTVRFSKRQPDGSTLTHEARILTCRDEASLKEVRLLTNDMRLPAEDVVAIYNKRWEIESLFKQFKQNFPLRYFYGESANAIKSQVWCTLIVNLLLTVLRRSVNRGWSFSGLASAVRCVLMAYIDIYSFLEHPEKDWERLLRKLREQSQEPSLFPTGGLDSQKRASSRAESRL